MTVQELLKPRYKLIADYPNSEFRVGDVLEFKSIYPYSGYALLFGSDKIISTEYLDDFKHLFKKLEWWDERKVEEMPEYVKMTAYIKPITNNDENLELEKGQIVKPEKWGLNSFEISHWVFSASLAVPAAEEEYLQYLSDK